MTTIKYTPTGLKDQEVAYTIRQPSSAILGIYSADRINPQVSTPYSFKIQKQENTLTGFFTRLYLSEIYFPWLVPNMNYYTNKVNVDISQGGVITNTVLVTIPVGFLSPEQIRAYIQAQVSAVLPTFAVYYGFQEKPIFIFATGSPAIEVRLNRVLNLQGDDGTRTQLIDMLGFPGQTSTIFDSQLIGSPTFCVFTEFIDIECPELTYNQSLKDGSSSSRPRIPLARVYITNGNNQHIPPSDVNFRPDGTSPFVIYKDYNNPKLIAWTPNQNVPGVLTFNIYDDKGFLLSDVPTSIFPSSQNWAMTILVSEN